MSKISVENLNETITQDKLLSKTETQVGVVSVVSDCHSVDGHEKHHESPLDPINETKKQSPANLAKKTPVGKKKVMDATHKGGIDGGVAVGRLGRFNTILLPNLPAHVPENRTDTVTEHRQEKENSSQFPDLAQADQPSELQGPETAESNIPVIACQITSTCDDKIVGRVISTSIQFSSSRQDESGGPTEPPITTTSKQIV